MAEEAAATLNAPALDTGDAATDTLLNGAPGAKGSAAPVATGEADATGTPGGEETVAGETGDVTAGSGDERAVPETYADFSLPEGVELDAQLLETAVPVFKELGLTQEQAQKLVDFQAKQVEEGQRKQADAFSQLMEDWQTQSRNDKEFGGEKFDENIAIARTAVNAFGTPELAKLLEDHGVGNHPEMIRFMVKVGKLTREDRPGATGGASNPAVDRVSALYPNG